MNTIKKIEKYANAYRTMITSNDEIAREYCEEYLEHISELQDYLIAYADSKKGIFKVYSDELERTLQKPKKSLFQILRWKVEVIVINYFLGKLSMEMAKAGMLGEMLKRAKQRMVQYQYLKQRK